MKKTAKIIRIIIIFALLITGGFFSYKLYHRLFTPTRFTISSNNILSASTLETINTFIDQKTDYTDKSIKSLAAQLKTTFPFIKEVAITQLPKTLAIHMNINKPLFVINNDLILLESGTLESLNLFKPDVFESLPSASIHKSSYHDKNLSQSCYNCLTSISRHLLDSYQLNWNNEQEVWLNDKKQPRFIILCNLQSIEDQKKLKFCSTLKNEIVRKKEFSHNKLNTWIADIRFDNQIIIFSRGGKGHGYNTFT